MNIRLLLALALALPACTSGQSGATTDITHAAVRPKGAAQAPAPSNTDWVPGYLDAAAKADLIEDDEKRCLEYPDIPGLSWDKAIVASRCGFLRAPALRLDDIESRLDASDGAQALDAYYAARLQAAGTGPDAGARQDGLFADFDVFSRYGLAGDIAREWLRHDPESPYAHLAVGMQALYEAQMARGTTYASDIPEGQDAYFVERGKAALEHLLTAARTLPELTPACALGADAANLLGEQEAWQELVGICLRTAPASYGFNIAWAGGTSELWGGSELDRNAVRDNVVKYRKSNPALTSVETLLDLDKVGPRAETSGSRVDALREAAAYAPNSLVLSRISYGYYQQGNIWLASAYAAQAYRFWPRDDTYLDTRYGHAARTGRFDDVLRIQRQRLVLNPYRLTSLASAYRLPHFIAQRDSDGAGEPMPADVDKKSTDALNAGNCLEQQVMVNPFFKTARACTAELVEQSPDSAYAWLTSAEWKLRTRKDPRKDIDRFLSLADRDDPYLAPLIHRYERLRTRLPKTTTL